MTRKKANPFLKANPFYKQMNSRKHVFIHNGYASYFEKKPKFYFKVDQLIGM